MDAIGGIRSQRRGDLGRECFKVLGPERQGNTGGVGTEKGRYQGCHFEHNMIEEPIRCPTDLPDKHDCAYGRGVGQGGREGGEGRSEER